MKKSPQDVVAETDRSYLLDAMGPEYDTDASTLRGIQHAREEFANLVMSIDPRIARINAALDQAIAAKNGTDVMRLKLERIAALHDNEFLRKVFNALAEREEIIRKKIQHRLSLTQPD